MFQRNTFPILTTLRLIMKNSPMIEMVDLRSNLRTAAICPIYGVRWENLVGNQYYDKCIGYLCLSPTASTVQYNAEQ